VSGNFIDICVLEWCKLFADKKGKHHWGNIVRRPDDFRVGLLHHLGTDDAGFQKDIDTMLRYRDKFIAHLDSDPIMYIPALDAAKKAVWFYDPYVLDHERANPAGLPSDLDAGYLHAETMRKWYMPTPVVQASGNDWCHSGAITVSSGSAIIRPV
jgi:hypothetical protein